MENFISISEVDCYIGNACRTKYATSRAVQHQILVNNKPLGRLNKPADNDRAKRILIKRNVSKEFIKLFNECIGLKKQMKSEFCKTIEEHKKASLFNKPLKDKLNNVIKKMHSIESLDLNFKTYLNILNY